QLFLKIDAITLESENQNNQSAINAVLCWT
ncbi:MAG: hypothetical protein RL099_1666, partial [Bacteroidota bacterium]